VALGEKKQETEKLVFSDCGRRENGKEMRFFWIPDEADCSYTVEMVGILKTAALFGMTFFIRIIQ